MSRSRSVAIVWDVDPIEESVSPLLSHLLGHGWDAHVLCERGDLPLDGLSPETRRRRIHPPPVDARRRAPRAKLVAGAMRAWLRRPGSARRVSTCPDPHLRYLGHVLLALDPAVVHFTSPDSARRFEQIPVRAHTVIAGDGDPPPARDDELLALAPRVAAEGDPLRVLSVGPLAWEEGYEYALQSIRLLADRDTACRYRIVGRGPFADAVWFARHQLGIERLVEIVEPGSRTALRAHLDWADVVVSAAVVPRRSRLLLDAMTAAVPIVATDLPESAAAAGRPVPKRDPEALAAALAELAQARALLGRLGEAGRVLAAEAISVEERFRRVEELYRAAPAAERP